MAITRWLGRAQVRAQVGTITLSGTIVANQTFTVTIGGQAPVVIVAANTVANDVLTQVYNALIASSFPEVREITWGVPSSGSMTYTGPSTDGRPLTIAVATSGAATFATAITTNPTGPNFFDNAANWSGAAVPTPGTDTLVFSNNDVGLFYNLAQTSTAGGYTVQYDMATCTSQIGLSSNNNSGYKEYRDQYLKITGGTLTTINGANPGPNLINIDFNATAATVNIQSTGNGISRECIRVRNMANTSTLTMTSGSLGVGNNADDGNSFFASAVVSGGTTNFGPKGCIKDSLTQTGGVILYDGRNINSASFCGTSFTKINGTFSVIGVASVGCDITNRNGTIVWLSTGSSSTKQITFTGGTLDVSLATSTLSFAKLNLYAGAGYNDPNGFGSYSGGIALMQCGIEDLSILKIGKNKTISY